MKKKTSNKLVGIVIVLILFSAGLLKGEDLFQYLKSGEPVSLTEIGEYAEAGSMEEVPQYKGNPYLIIDGNQPSFSNGEITTKSDENYESLDSLGRCGTAQACIGRDLMPVKERESIGMIKPSGWHTVRYANVDGKYLYNRCHLIGYQLTGENANKKNLITGTRALNMEGMLPFENQVADYIRETGNHVMYRATPVFEGENLLATGVQLEAYSVEDSGSGVCFNVFCFNAQEGIEIDYATGDSWKEEEEL